MERDALLSRWSADADGDEFYDAPDLEHSIEGEVVLLRQKVADLESKHQPNWIWTGESVCYMCCRVLTDLWCRIASDMMYSVL